MSPVDASADVRLRASVIGIRLAALAVLAGLVVFLVLVSLAIGARPIALTRVFDVLVWPDGSREALVVWQLRMPRTALGIVAAWRSASPAPSCRR